MLLLRALTLSGVLADVQARGYSHGPVTPIDDESIPLVQARSKWAAGPANTPPMGFNTVREAPAPRPPPPSCPQLSLVLQVTALDGMRMYMLVESVPLLGDG